MILVQLFLEDIKNKMKMAHELHKTRTKDSKSINGKQIVDDLELYLLQENWSISCNTKYDIEMNR